MSRKLLLFGLVMFILILLPDMASAAGCDNANIVFSEIDYDQPGSDSGEFIELEFKNTGAVSDCELHLVNQSATQYGTIAVDGSYSAGQYVAFFQAGIQNGDDDGFALVDTSGGGATVIWFYSYEGTITGYDAVTGGSSGTSNSIELGASDPADVVGENVSVVNGPAAGVGDCTQTTKPTPNAANLTSAASANSVTLASFSATSSAGVLLFTLPFFSFIALGAGLYTIRRHLV